MNLRYWVERAMRQVQFGKYQKKYGFNDWHMIPKSVKLYVNDIVSYIHDNSKYPKSLIIEVGVGLGDILCDKRLDSHHRIGFDLKKSLVEADKDIYSNLIKQGRIEFKQGECNDVSKYDAEFFIAVNFLHNLSLENVEQMLSDLVSDNNIGTLILDAVDAPGYKYYHKFDFFLNKGFTKKRTLGPYKVKNGNRFVFIFEKSENIG